MEKKSNFDIVCHECGSKDGHLYIIKKVTEHQDNSISKEYWIEIKCPQCDKILEKEMINDD